MSLKESMLNELKRSPIATITGVSCAALAALGLLIAWSQSQDSAPLAITLNNNDSSTQIEIHLGNLLLIIGYFVSLTISTAFFVRALARKHDIAALAASIPIAALTNFSTILLIYLAPPKALNQDSFSSAHDLLLYASAVVYVAFCGLPVLRDIATPSQKEAESSKEAPDALAALFFCFIILAIWCSLVFSGQERLTKTLLPEVAHYVDPTPSK
ncbi:hypothetical protein [Stutzerimonas nitrititolerans]|uniref:hypothetical protein n=1 Tax=Stutzerimonas nitrititolerans TaxID=2482751 RepID=UPI0015E3358C|nr:hypothetical protein [Stutzerimonas nitrititolerans]MBA1183784.1 hypothetical protein [Stutzerimonas stutzeri]